MKRIISLIIILLILVAVLLTPVFAVDVAAGNVSSNGQTPARFLPADISSSTIAVFIFRPSGEANAKYYAAAFAVALSDRLYCAPTSITQQYSPSEINHQLYYDKISALTPLSDDTAKKVGRELGVRYVVTGNLHIAKDIVAVKINITDLKSKSAVTVARVSEPLSKLPSMQVELAQKIATVMNLKLNPVQAKELQEPNFLNPKALLLYGQAYSSKDKTKSAAYRWDAAKADSNSAFTTIRLLEYYVYGPMTYKDIIDETRLPDLISNSEKSYPGNSHMELLKGLLWAKKSELRVAQIILEARVEGDPNMYRAHSGLAYVARCRQDGALAGREGEALTAMWPGNPYAHVALSCGHKTASDNARHGHFYDDMTSEVEEKWAENMEASKSEALKAIKLNRNCYDAWSQLLWADLSLGDDSEMQKAYKEMLRLEPKSIDVFLSKATTILPQWGGSQKDRDNLVKQVDKTFGKNSFEVSLITAKLAYHSAAENKDWDKVLQLIDKAVQRSGGNDSRALYMKAKATCYSKKWAEYAPQILEITKKAFATWHTQEWRFMVGYWSQLAYTATYKSAPDVSLFNDAYKQFSTYVEEMPFEPGGRDQLGMLLISLYKKDDAKAQFEKALELDPADKCAQGYLNPITAKQ